LAQVIKQGGAAVGDVRIERMVYGPRDWVIHAWRTPELLAGWFSPDPARSVTAEVDFSPGGWWRVMMGDDVVRGSYTEVSLPDRFAFSWRDGDGPDASESMVTVRLTERSDASTELLLEHAGLDGDDADDRERGWAESLERLDRLVREKVAETR
jgi:uncharacterized protein YndB with AHSA1/START domain